MGEYWRAGEAIVGTLEGIRRATAIRPVGAHRKGDADGPAGIHGLSWSWSPGAEFQLGDIYTVVS